jgi:NAD(P)-dependent dehydrogenase (short-subunit alcohol dehydrogenase family)
MTSILVTGAARGIGHEILKQALAKGWDVYGSVRTKDAIVELADILPDATILQFDVTDHMAIERAGKELDKPIDILINNAGILGPDNQSTVEMDFRGFRDVFETNTIAPLKIAQVFLPHLNRGKNPRLINISSQLGRTEYEASNMVAYRTSKAALNKITQAQAYDFEQAGITCVAMHPGYVQTDMAGASADIPSSQSAAGILNVAENLTIDQAGTFIDGNGTTQNW